MQKFHIAKSSLRQKYAIRSKLVYYGAWGGSLQELTRRVAVMFMAAGMVVFTQVMPALLTVVIAATKKVR